MRYSNMLDATNNTHVVISAGDPATYLSAVLVLADADTMTSVVHLDRHAAEAQESIEPIGPPKKRTLAAAGNSI